MLPNFPLIFGKSHYVAFCLVISSSMNFTKKIKIIILTLELTQLPTTLPQISPVDPGISSHGQELPFLLSRRIPPPLPRSSSVCPCRYALPSSPAALRYWAAAGGNHSPALRLLLEFWPTGLCRRLERERRGRSADTAPWAPPG